ncbi:MAG: YbgA family protein [Lentisphaeria bacterium]
MEKMKIGISRCLLGENVRYDGQHKLDHYLRDDLGQFVDYVGICPEVECGMLVPREAMHLEKKDGEVLLVTSKEHADKTVQMQNWLALGENKLISNEICGIIFKSKSPSCGMERVKIYENGNIEKNGSGLFAYYMKKNYPWLPIEEEGRLHDSILRENFIDRIFMLWRWQRMLASNGHALEKLRRFHLRNCYLLYTHSREDTEVLSKLCQLATIDDVDGVYSSYFHGLMNIMKLSATVSKKVNVMKQMCSFFNPMLSAFESKELKLEITKFEKHYVPEVLPLTLISHYSKKYKILPLMRQSYLQPHPYKLKLRNHV